MGERRRLYVVAARKIFLQIRFMR